MPLPLRYVEEIHARLAVRYGSAWTTKWAGLDQAAIVADWAAQLDGMQPASISKALASLQPEFPPTAAAFRRLGEIREEAAPMPALPAPDPVGMRRIAQSVAPLLNRMEPPRDWMARLERDVKAEAAKARISHYNIAMANGYYGNLPQVDGGDFTPIDPSTLPPGMRAVAPARVSAPAGETPAWATEQ